MFSYFCVVSLTWVVAGAYIGVTESAEGNIHRGAHVRGAPAGIRSFPHPELTSGHRRQVR